MWHAIDFAIAPAMGTGTGQRNLPREFHGLRDASYGDWQRFHDLRHGCDSLLMAQGVNPRVVMEILAR